MSTTVRKLPVSCKFFLQGRCTRGQKCRFSHDNKTVQAQTAATAFLSEFLLADICRVIWSYFPNPYDDFLTFKHLAERFKEKDKEVEEAYLERYGSENKLPYRWLHQLRHVPLISNEASQNYVVYFEEVPEMEKGHWPPLHTCCYSTKLDAVFAHAFGSLSEWGQELAKRIDPVALDTFGAMETFCILIYELTYFGYKQHRNRLNVRDMFAKAARAR